jgi:hypothetical protein
VAHGVVGYECGARQQSSRLCSQPRRPAAELTPELATVAAGGRARNRGYRQRCSRLISIPFQTVYGDARLPTLVSRRPWRRRVRHRRRPEFPLSPPTPI